MILNRKDIAIKISELKKAGKKIVFTNGCFDLIHPGHVIYLTKAAELGDILVVALNSDDSVSRLKGLSRPLNTLEDRSVVMNALKPVSFVTSFSEDTPKEVIEEIIPDVLVKGGDYKKEEVVGGDFVEANGGKVEIIKFVEGKSTTKIINKMN